MAKQSRQSMRTLIIDNGSKYLQKVREHVNAVAEQGHKVETISQRSPRCIQCGKFWSG